MKKILLDLGCGKRKQPDHIGVDRAMLEGVDMVCDIGSPLPLADNSVDGVYSNFVLEHVPDLAVVVKELYRVCKDRSVIRLRVPYWSSFTQWKDPTHRQVITEETFRYFSKEDWYGSDYAFGTDFKIVDIKYVYLPPFDRRWIPDFFKRFMKRYFINIVHSMWVELEVLK